MAFQVFLFLLVFFLLLALARLGHLYLPHQQPSHSKAGVISTTVQRLLKPRTPLAHGLRNECEKVLIRGL